MSRDTRSYGSFYWTWAKTGVGSRSEECRFPPPQAPARDRDGFRASLDHRLERVFIRRRAISDSGVACALAASEQETWGRERASTQQTRSIRMRLRTRRVISGVLASGCIAGMALACGTPPVPPPPPPPRIPSCANGSLPSPKNPKNAPLYLNLSSIRDR